jgi:hypothetical protein
MLVLRPLAVPGSGLPHGRCAAWLMLMLMLRGRRAASLAAAPGADGARPADVDLGGCVCKGRHLGQLGRQLQMQQLVVLLLLRAALMARVPLLLGGPCACAAVWHKQLRLRQAQAARVQEAVGGYGGQRQVRVQRAKGGGGLHGAEVHGACAWRAGAGRQGQAQRRRRRCPWVGGAAGVVGRCLAEGADVLAAAVQGGRDALRVRVEGELGGRGLGGARGGGGGKSWGRGRRRREAGWGGRRCSHDG